MIFSFSKSLVTGQMVILMYIIDAQTQVLQAYVCQSLRQQSHIHLKATNVSQGQLLKDHFSIFFTTTF